MRHERVGALSVVLADVRNIVRVHATILAALEVRKVRRRRRTRVLANGSRLLPSTNLPSSFGSSHRSLHGSSSSASEIVTAAAMFQRSKQRCMSVSRMAHERTRTVYLRDVHPEDHGGDPSVRIPSVGNALGDPAP
jgi:hypothetical protein